MSTHQPQKVLHQDLERAGESSEKEAWEVIQAAYDPIDEAVIGFLPVLESAEEDTQKS